MSHPPRHADEGPCRDAADRRRPFQLATRLSLSKQAINDLLRDLERLDYVRVEPDPGDRRARVIRFTERGWRLYGAAARRGGEIANGRAREVGVERVEQMEATLREIVATCRPDLGTGEAGANVVPPSSERGRMRPGPGRPAERPEFG